MRQKPEDHRRTPCQLYVHFEMNGPGRTVTGNTACVKNDAVFATPSTPPHRLRHRRRKRNASPRQLGGPPGADQLTTPIRPRFSIPTHKTPGRDFGTRARSPYRKLLKARVLVFRATTCRGPWCLASRPARITSSHGNDAGSARLMKNRTTGPNRGMRPRLPMELMVYKYGRTCSRSVVVPG
jgi:hypothetical protein